MSEFGINFNSPRVEDDKKTKDSSQTTQKSQQTFINSITEQLNSYGVNSNMKAQFTSQAVSIFNQYDTDGTTGWSAQEEQNAGNAIKQFWNSVKSAVTSSVSGTQGTSEVQGSQGVQASNGVSEMNSVPSQQDVQKAQAEFINKFTNASPAEQKQMIQQEINDLKAAGYEVSSVSENGDITIKNPDGTSDSINIYEAMGVQKPESTSADTNEAVNNLGNSLDAYMEKGFVPTGTPEKNQDGDLIGTLKNSQTGEEIKFNLNKNKVVEE